jgi:hypothetical protein
MKTLFLFSFVFLSVAVCIFAGPVPIGGNEGHVIEKRSPTFFLMNNGFNGYRRRAPAFYFPWYQPQRQFASQRFDRVSSFNEKYPDYDKFLQKRSIDDDDFADY